MHALRQKRFSALETLGLLALGIWGVQGIGHALTVPGIAPGEVAKASDVQAIVDAVTALEEKLQFVTVIEGDLDGLAGPHWILSGVNLHLESGAGSTDEDDCNGTGAACTGLGNLIVGYNEPDDDPESGGRTGSHNLVLGSEHEYTSYGGIVAGRFNNLASGWASVTGGFANTVANRYTSVSGGRFNTASGLYASVSGGYTNIAGGPYASVSGGGENSASGSYASVSGGFTNTASHSYASVSGGANRSAAGIYDWAAGSLSEGN